MSISLCPKEVFKINLFLIFLLLTANILGIVSKFYFDHDSVYGLVGLFDFNTEKNIPTFYSAIALLVASILLSLIAFARKKVNSPFIQWFVLSLIFLFLSIDEISTIHERAIRPTKEALNASGLFYFAWIIPYGIALGVFIIAYSKFLFKLPKNIMILFLISGTTFISGAIGIEMFEGRHAELHGTNNITFALFYSFEEFLEMIGIAIFIYTLLTYIVNEFDSLKITIVKKQIE